MRHRISLAVLALVAAGCSNGAVSEDAQLLPFQDSVVRPGGGPLWELEFDGVSVELFDLGECALIIETVPEYGILVDEICLPAEASPVTTMFETPNCPYADFGDECVDWLPELVAGRTVAEAQFVCVAKGRVEVRNGWWLTSRVGVGAEAFPLTFDGVRLDSMSNEFDDRMRAVCDAVDPAPSQ